MDFDKRLLSILRNKDRAIQAAETELLEGLTAVESDIFKAVKNQLNKMNKEGGKFVFDETNTNLVNQLDQIIVDEIQRSDYPGSVRKYLQDFDAVTDYNGELHESLNNIPPDDLKKLVDPFKQQTVEDTLRGLTGSGVSVNFVEPVRQELFKNIVSGANAADVEAVLRQMIEGDADRLGGLSRYVGQVTRDALNQYDGQINAKIADEFNLDAFQYVGSLIDDSRPQCQRWVNKEVILKEDLQKEINWANSNGSGMIPGTMPDNFAVFRGGYNCRHTAIPFKMTKSERERLKKEQEKPIKEKVETPLPEQAIQDDPKKAVLKPLAEKELKLTYGKTRPELIPETLKDRPELLSKLPDQIFILSDNGKANVTKTGSFYQPSSKEVTIGLNSDRYKSSIFSQAKVTIHEFAHRTHYERKLIDAFNLEENTRAAFIDCEKMTRKRIKEDKDFANFNFNYRELLGKFEKKYKDIFSADEVKEMFVGYADTLQALTNSKIGFGHEKAYMRQYNGRFKEWFAHASENYFQGNVVFKDHFPELFDRMNEYFSKEVIKKNLKQ